MQSTPTSSRASIISETIVPQPFSKRGSRLPAILRSPIIAFAIYSLLALLAYRPLLPGESTLFPFFSLGDDVQEVWFQSWIPYALAHGLNPFYTTWTNYPDGVNLAQNVSAPFLGLLSAPITVWLSPIASYNLLLWLSFPLSATAMYFVAKRFTSSAPAAFAAGLLYGFSGYIVGQAAGHDLLSFVPIPPLFFYQLHKLIIQRSGHPYRDGAVLGLLVILQYYISLEIFATMLLIGTLAIVLGLTTNLHHVTRGLIGYAARGLLFGVAVTAIAISYPTWMMLHGPQHVGTTLSPGGSNYWANALLDPLFPTRGEFFAPTFLSQYGAYPDFIEFGTYLGIPLLVLVSFFLIRFRKNRYLLFCGAMSALAFVISLGSHLIVLTRSASPLPPHTTGAPLPFLLISKLPFFSNALPSRLSLYVILFVSLLIAMGIKETIAPGRGEQRRAHYNQRRVRWDYKILSVGILGVLSILTLLPNWPYPMAPTNVPKFFTTTAVDRIRAGSVVLTYPFPISGADEGLLWQAMSGMRFKEVGEYAKIPNPQGQVVNVPPFLPPAAVTQYLLIAEGMGPTAGLGNMPLPPLGARLVRDLRLYLRRYHIGAVVLGRSDPDVHGIPTAEALFTRALGAPENIQGVSAWFDVQGAIGRTSVQ